MKTAYYILPLLWIITGIIIHETMDAVLVAV